MIEPFIRALAVETRVVLEKHCRDRAQFVNIGGSRVLCRVLSDYMFVVNAEDCSVTPHLILNGMWEMWITQAVARHVKPGMRCIDVGANAGYYTVLLGHLVGPTGRVQAWEPNPELCDCLRLTVPLNGLLDHVDVIRAAASSEMSKAELRVPTSYWGGATLMKLDKNWTGRQNQIQVDLLPLDTRFEGPVDFIKIDAEGHEPEIWAGAQKTLAASPKLAVLLEFNTVRYADPRAFIQRIQVDGFKLNRVEYTSVISPISEAAVLASKSFEMLWLTR